MLRILMLDLAGPAKWVSKWRGHGTLKSIWILDTWAWWQPFNSFCFETFIFFHCLPFLFLLLKKWGVMPPFPWSPWCCQPYLVNTVKYFFIHCIQIILRDFPSKLITAGSIKSRHGGYVFHLQGNSNARKKCLVVSISVPQLHICLK